MMARTSLPLLTLMLALFGPIGALAAPVPPTTPQGKWFVGQLAVEASQAFVVQNEALKPGATDEQRRNAARLACLSRASLLHKLSALAWKDDERLSAARGALEGVRCPGNATEPEARERFDQFYSATINLRDADSAL